MKIKDKLQMLWFPPTKIGTSDCTATPVHLVARPVHDKCSSAVFVGSKNYWNENQGPQQWFGCPWSQISLKETANKTYFQVSWASCVHTSRRVSWGRNSSHRSLGFPYSAHPWSRHPIGLVAHQPLYDQHDLKPKWLAGWNDSQGPTTNG